MRSRQAASGKTASRGYNPDEAGSNRQGRFVIRAQSKMLACGAICACILLTTCGGGKQPSDVSLQLSDRNDGSQATEELVSQ
ncbi:hypothetical protein J7J84_06720, partial [bacterium]|nr:hypothetical protein [bacterium]